MVRFPLLDQIRGTATALMVIFHSAYDLNTFQLVDLNFHESGFWYYLPRLIVFLFMFCAGMSLGITHYPHPRWKKFTLRFLKISLSAGFISVVTYFMFPQRWIYFGTLHSIAVCGLLALPMVRFPKSALIMGLITIGLHLFSNLDLSWPVMGHSSMDYIPIVPWIGVVLSGIFATHIKLHQHRLKILETSNVGIDHFLSFLGRNSLLIYFAHRPLVFGLAYALSHLER